MPNFEHPSSRSADDNLARIRFELEEIEAADGETLWAERLPNGGFRIANVPLLVFGLSFGDVVSAYGDGDSLDFADVVARSGHSTYRVVFKRSQLPAATGRFRELVVLGCPYESLNEAYHAIDVPPDVAVHRVYELLERGMADDLWWFDEGYCGHPT